MKKGLLYLMMLVMSASMFTACSDDKDDVSPLVNTWTTVSGEENDPIISIRMENATDSVVFMGSKVPNENFKGFMNQVLGAYVKEYLFSVTFKSDGDLIASIKGENDQPTQSPNGAVSYQIKGDQVYLIPHLDVMFPELASLNSRATEAPSIDLDKILKEGLPVNYKITGNKLEVYVTRDMMLPFMSMINELIQGIDANGDYMISMIQMVMPDMITIVQESTKFEMGLNFNLTTTTEK